MKKIMKRTAYFFLATFTVYSFASLIVVVSELINKY
jgi:hypothetical protein